MSSDSARDVIANAALAMSSVSPARMRELRRGDLGTWTTVQVSAEGAAALVAALDRLNPDILDTAMREVTE